MNRMDRMMAIVMMLQGQKQTAVAIARKLEVSRRTVLRDIQSLCEMGVPVVAEAGPGGGFSLPEGYFLPPLVFSAKEATVLLTAAQALAQYPESPFGPERESAVAKLRSLLGEAERAEADHLLGKLQVWVPVRKYSAPFMDLVIETAGRSGWLKVRYRSLTGQTERTIRPDRVYASEGFWYAEAFDPEKGESRTFRLDRFAAAEPSPPPAAVTPAPPAKPYDDPSHPTVHARLTYRGARIVEREPWIGHLMEEREGWADLTFRCPPDELAWFARYFLGLGPEAEVLAPLELRQAIHRLAQELADTYGR